MINTKLYNILTSFSKEDWNNFILFTKSADANSDRKHFPIVSELNKYNNRLSELKGIHFSDILKKAYKKEYNAKTISNRQSELLNLIKDFLKFNAYNKNKLLQTNLYFEELISRNLINIFAKEYNEQKDNIENNFYDSNSFNLVSQIFGTLAEYYAIKRNRNSSLEAIDKFNSYLLADILSRLYDSGQLIQLLEYHKFSRYEPLYLFLNSIESDKFFDELENQNNPIFTIPLIHYYIFKSFQKPDSFEYVSKAEQLFFANEKNFPEKFRLHVYKMIMNYYNIGNNNGKNYFMNLFLLIKRKLENNLVSDLKDHYAIDTNVFREYIITGLEVKQFDWVEMVINKYSPILPEDVREDERKLALARLHFERKEYDKTVEITNNYKFNNERHYFDAKKLLLKSLYELEDYEECYQEIDKAKHYIRNNKVKLLEVRTSSFKIFLNRFSKLLKYSSNPLSKDSNNIIYELEKSISSNNLWICEKLKEISGKLNIDSNKKTKI